MAETRDSRYITSSDGLQMQGQATEKIAQATAQGVQRIQQGQQQYFEGVQQNNNNIATLQQQLAQVDLAGASRPSSLSQLSAGIVQGLAGYKEEKDARDKQTAAQAAAAAKIEAENAKNRTLTKYTQALGDLTDSYESTNWANGEEQYKRDAIILVQNLPPDADPEIKKQLIEGIYANTKARNAKVGERLAKADDELRAGKVDVAKSQLMVSLSSVVSSIANQTVDAQAKPYLDQADGIITTFLQTDNGLTTGAKLSIVSQAMETVNGAYGKKHSRYLERTSMLQDWKAYASEYKILEAKEAAGQISFDQMKNAQAELDFRYPGFADKITKRGDEEQRNLALQNLSEAQRKLNEEAGARAIANVRFTGETVKALVAAAYSDPSLYNQLKNDPAYKDNPQFQEAVKGADRMGEYYKGEGQLIVAQANAATQFAKLDLSNLQTINSLNRSIATKNAAGQQLTATELMAQDYIRQMSGVNPDLAASLELNVQGKPVNQIDTALLQQGLRQQTAVIENIKQTILQDIEAKRAALYKEFPDLQNYGFLGQPQEAVRAYAKNSSKFLERELESVQRARLEAQQLQQQTSQYGIQPNFNPSSAYATSVDGTGKVKVVPRSRAQIIRLPDGASVVTPIIAGVSAAASFNKGMGGGGFGAGRDGGSRKHAGVDFGASQGARAISLVGGTVVHVGSNVNKSGQGYGGYVDILGDNGVVYRYGHQAAQVKVGQRVGAGDVVSVSDGSGSGDPHLHFEVHPNPRFVNGKYQPSFGKDATTDPIEHLRKLTAKDSNVLTPRLNSSAYRTAPNQKVPINSTLTSGGGAINGGVYQRMGGKPGNVSSRVNEQRPMSHGKAPFKVNVGQVAYDYNNHYGYGELAKDTGLRKAFTNAAKELGVPTEWLVDIARQESGGINPYKDHNGNHYGLFGFGSDSLSDKSQYKKLRAGQVDAAGQLRMYVSYLKENGWEKVVKQKKGAVTVADLWAATRMGWNMRQKFWQTGNVNVKTNYGLTYADELKLLGKHAGRSYALPGSRSLRSSAIGTEEHASCGTCVQLAASNTFAPHTHQQA